MTSANFSLPLFISASVLVMMVVEEIMMIPPRYTLSVALQPKSRPIWNPAKNMRLVSSGATMKAVAPICRILRKLNSRPSAKRRKTTPSSESVWMLSRSDTSGEGRTCGPMITPARM